MENEIWVPVAWYEENYEVSSLGRCRNRKGEIMPARPNSKGYLYVELYKNGRRRHIRVNRMVAEAFLGPVPGEEYEADHKDDDRQNNAASNLQWLTKQENSEKAHNKPVRCVETGEEFKNIKMAAASVNRSSSNISSSIKRNGTCAGYHWEFIKGEETK